MIKFNRVKKYQGGGVNIPLYQASPKTPVYSQPLQFMQEGSGAASPAKSSMTKDSGGNSTWKGLPSDLAVRNKALSQLVQLESNLTDLDFLSGTKEALEYQQGMNFWNSDTLKTRYESNLKNYDSFVEEAKTKGDSYVTSGKQILAKKQTSNGPVFQMVSPGQLTSDIVPVTVAEMIQQRRVNPDFAGDAGDVIYNAILETKTHSDWINYLKDHTTGLGKKLNETHLKGLAFAGQAAENAVEFKRKFESNEGNIQMALTSALNVMPINLRTQLIASVKANNPSLDNEELQKEVLKTIALGFNKKISESSFTSKADFTTLKDSGSGSTDKKDPQGSYVSAVRMQNPKSIPISWGGETLPLYGQRVDAWKSKSETDFLMQNESFKRAADVLNTYALDGQKLADKKDGHLLSFGTAKDAPVFMKHVPVDETGKPLLNKDNIDKIAKFNRIAIEKGIEAAKKETGITSVKFKEFYVTNMLGPSESTYFGIGEDPILKEANKGDTDAYKIMKPKGFDDDDDYEVFNYIAITPAFSNEAAARADNSVTGSQGKVYGEQLTTDVFSGQPTQFTAVGVDGW
jgi:hypothetical protein